MLTFSNFEYLLVKLKLEEIHHLMRTFIKKEYSSRNFVYRRLTMDEDSPPKQRISLIKHIVP